MAGAWWLAADGVAARAAGLGGLLATTAQSVAHAWMAGVPTDAPMTEMWRRHLHGTAMRAGAAAVAVLLVLKYREAFPPLATVLGFAGVLLGVMALEIRNRA